MLSMRYIVPNDLKNVWYEAPLRIHKPNTRWSEYLNYQNDLWQSLRYWAEDEENEDDLIELPWCIKSREPERISEEVKDIDLSFLDELL